MNIIKKEIRKCDLLAARYYKLAEGDRERAARDWYDQVTKVTKMIEAVKFGDSKKLNIFTNRESQTLVL